MGEKSTFKKQLIVEKAGEVFAAKGFTDVTMKDIVEACNISRGGLYLYFGSTEEVFLEVLKAASVEDEAEVDKAMEGALSAGDMLAVFLKEQKKIHSELLINYLNQKVVLQMPQQAKILRITT